MNVNCQGQAPAAPQYYRAPFPESRFWEADMRRMRDAGHGGGFILSTGDQCGPATPEENLFALVETAKTHGGYNARGEL